jgi:HlyD family secretion protein
MVLEEFTYDRQMAELEANAEEFKRELDRVRLQNEAIIAQMETELRSLQKKLELEQSDLERFTAQLEASTIIAPQAGDVVYANLGDDWRGGEDEQIRAGATVRETQAIVNLPDNTQLKVDCKLHESLISSIRVGLPVRILLDSRAGEVYNGRVQSISSVAQSGDWRNRDLREYSVEIHLTDPPERVSDLMPGLTAKCEIIVDSRQNVLQIPLQCVVAIGREHYAWVLTADGPERRPLTVGAANTSHIEILDGIAEGEAVVQNPRTHFASEISQREAEASAARDQETAEMTEGEIPPASTGGPQAGGPGTGGRGERGGRGEGGAPGAGGAGGANRMADMFRQADADGDGKLSETEIAEPLRPSFSQIDADGDGGVTQEEMGAFFQSQGGGRPGGGPPAGDSTSATEPNDTVTETADTGAESEDAAADAAAVSDAPATEDTSSGSSDEE